MTQDRWYERAPRYILQTTDRRQLRFASIGERGTSTYANLRNLSESGLSFTVDVADAPEEGDVIKAEFTIPGQRQLACFALVVRVELESVPDSEWGARDRANIAVHFHDLSPAAVRILQRGLLGRADEHERLGDIDLQMQRRIRRKRIISAGIGIVALFLVFLAIWSRL